MNIEYAISRGSRYSHRVWNSSPLLIVGERVYDLKRVTGWLSLIAAAIDRFREWWKMDVRRAKREDARVVTDSLHYIEINLTDAQRRALLVPPNSLENVK